MKLFAAKILLSVAALNLVSGAAVPQPEALPEAVAEAIPAPGDITELQKRETNGAYCWKYKGPYSSYYRLSTWGEWDQDWGAGLWDNVRGKCNGIIDRADEWWFGFESGPPPTNGMAQFRMIRENYDSHCVEDAVWAASNAKGGAIWNMNCNPSDKWW